MTKSYVAAWPDEQANQLLKHPTYRPHVTLKRDANWSELANFVHLNGPTLAFDRHGGEV